MGGGRRVLVCRRRPTCFVSVAAAVVNAIIVRNHNDAQQTMARIIVREVFQGPGGVHAPLVVHGSVHADLAALLRHVVACRPPVAKWGR